MIKGCHIGRFEGGLEFENFECSLEDAAGWIDQLIVHGYIEREAENQQVILYKEDKCEDRPACTRHQPEVYFELKMFTKYHANQICNFNIYVLNFLELLVILSQCYVLIQYICII